jgi:hypothetical protein
MEIVYVNLRERDLLKAFSGGLIMRRTNGTNRTMKRE